MKLTYKPTTVDSLFSMLDNASPFHLFDMINSSTARGNIITGDTVRFNSTADVFTVEVDLPGAKREHTQVEVTGNQVFITAKRSITTQSGTKEEVLTRSFVLDKEADTDTIDAHQEDGVLIITAKRKNAEKFKTRTLKIS